MWFCSSSFPVQGSAGQWLWISGAMTSSIGSYAPEMLVFPPLPCSSRSLTQRSQSCRITWLDWSRLKIGKCTVLFFLYRVCRLGRKRVEGMFLRIVSVWLFFDFKLKTDRDYCNPIHFISMLIKLQINKHYNVWHAFSLFFFVIKKIFLIQNIVKYK